MHFKKLEFFKINDSKTSNYKFLEGSYKNVSIIWTIIKNIINRQKKDSRFLHRLDKDQKSYKKPIVYKLNIHFSNIGKQTSTKKGNPIGTYWQSKKC